MCGVMFHFHYWCPAILLQRVSLLLRLKNNSGGNAWYIISIKIQYETIIYTWMLKHKVLYIYLRTTWHFVSIYFSISLIASIVTNSVESFDRTHGTQVTICFHSNVVSRNGRNPESITKVRHYSKKSSFDLMLNKRLS